MGNHLRRPFVAVVAVTLCACTPDAKPKVECSVSGEPEACGVGNVCQRKCGTDNKWGECLPKTGPTDYTKDPLNCGDCGNACPVPAHASATCTASKCGRGPCAAGYFDLDGAQTFGCEASCTGTTCTDAGGHLIQLTAAPVAETGLGINTLASGSSMGAQVQTTPTHTNIGILGEPTPPLTGGQPQTNGDHVNQPGIISAVH